MAVVHRLDSGPLGPVPLTEDSPLRTQIQTYSPEALARARSAFPWIDAEYDKVQVEKAISSDPELARRYCVRRWCMGPEIHCIVCIRW
jgi:hypothetical protein